MPRPKWTPEQHEAARLRRENKKTAENGNGISNGSGTEPMESVAPESGVSASASASTISTLPTSALPATSTVIAPFNRILRNGQELARVSIKALTESLTSPDAPPPVHERLAELVHVNTAIPKLRDANRVKEIAWIRYQIDCQMKALAKVSAELEIEGRELLITYDCGETPMRFDFLRIKLGRGGGGERIIRKKLEAAGVPLDTISQCSNPVKSWERMQVEDATEIKKSRGEEEE